MGRNPPGFMTTPKERVSYWTFFVGQNIYYNLTAAFITTYLAMQGIPLAKVGTVLLIVKVWDAINDPIFGFISIFKGIRIHRFDCPNADNMREKYPYRMLPARWAKKNK